MNMHTTYRQQQHHLFQVGLGSRATILFVLLHTRYQAYNNLSYTIIKITLPLGRISDPISSKTCLKGGRHNEN